MLVSIFPWPCNGTCSGVVCTSFVESRSLEVVVRSLHKFGLALKDTFLELGHLIKFGSQDLFYKILLEQPLIRGSYFACYAVGIHCRVGSLDGRGSMESPDRMAFEFWKACSTEGLELPNIDEGAKKKYSFLSKIRIF